MTTLKRGNFTENLLKNKFVKYFLFAAAILLSFPNFLFSTYYLCVYAAPDRIAYCVDESWHTALNIALEKSFVFGRDLIFTYGPLGFLSTRVDFGINFLYLVLFDVFIAANIGFIIWYIWKRHFNFGVIIITLLICYLSPVVDASFKLLFIMLFWLVIGAREKSASYFLVPFAVAVVSFFIKINTSFIAIFIFYIFLLAALFKNEKSNTGKIILGLALPPTILLASKIFNVDLNGYVFNGLELIGKYNDAMNFIAPASMKYTILIAATAVASWFGFLILFFKGEKSIPRICSLTAFCLVSFVLFKQSVVRNDGEHLFAYLFFAPVLWIFAVLFFGDDFRRVRKIVVGLAAAVIIIGVLPLRHFTNRAEFNPLNRRKYYAQIFTGGDEQTKNRAREHFKMPDDVLQSFGAKTADVMPLNVNLIYQNNLNYRPRPIFQSYAAFSDELINLNRQAYEGENAPEMIIFSNEIIDDRYALFDDQGAKIAMLEKYSVVKKFSFSENEYLLLEKNATSKSANLGAAENATITFYEDFAVKDLNKMYLVKVKIDYSMFGKISRILYQPLRLKIVFTLDDGTTREFRAVNPILESGVIVNPFVETDEDYEKFFKGETQSLKKIKSFRLEPFYDGNFEKLNLLNYKEPIKIESHELSIN